MKSITPNSKQRTWMVAVCGDYSALPFAELTEAHAALLADLVAADAYGLVAGRAIRRHCLVRLSDLCTELQRRSAETTTVVQAPAPRALRHRHPFDRPAA